jgi:3-oxoacyl-[acyl-carrier-protein] synthase II
MTRSFESPRRVVITGAGVVSPLGIGYETFGKNLLEGKSGISRLQSVSYSGAPKNVAGEIKDFTETTAKNEYLKKQRKSIKVMCREIQFGVASASLAIENAGLDLEAIDHERFGVDFGANLMFSPPQVLKDPCWLCVDEGDPEFHFKHEMWGTKGLSNL